MVPASARPGAHALAVMLPSMSSYTRDLHTIDVADGPPPLMGTRQGVYFRLALDSTGPLGLLATGFGVSSWAFPLVGG
jgi:hypothetical protein